MAQACVVFEDSFVDHLRPINLARPTCSVTCGALTLQSALGSLGLPIYYHVREHLRPILERDNLALANTIDGPILYVNASLLPDLTIIARIQELAAAKQPFLALRDQQITAAWSPDPFPTQLCNAHASELVSHILNQRLPLLDDEFPTLEYPFDVIRHHERLLPGHLKQLVERGNYREIDKNVFVGQGGQIAANVVFDTTDGPIILEDNVRVKPFSYIAGPVRIGTNSLVIDHASIKHGTVLGHTVKAGGELEAVIIEPFSNKQHHGFLGHAYIGSWCNLGAGTSNSDLKNTYGEIAIEVDGRSVPTGLQFLGCAIGDYTKTAINTSIFTGKLVGAASFVYGFVTTNVPSFTNYARSFGQVTEVSLEVAIKTQARAAARRKVIMTAADTLMMQHIFDLTRVERQLSSDQVVL